MTRFKLGASVATQNKREDITEGIRTSLRKTNEVILKWAVTRPNHCVTDSFTRSIFLHNLQSEVEHTLLNKWDWGRLKKLIGVSTDKYGFVEKLYLTVAKYKTIYLIDKDYFEKVQNTLNTLSYDVYLPDQAHAIIKQSNPNDQVSVHTILDLSQIKGFKFGK